MTTEEKLDLAAKEIDKALGDLYPYLGYSAGIRLQECAIHVQLLNKSYQQLVKELRAELEPTKLPPIPTTKKPEWNN